MMRRLSPDDSKEAQRHQWDLVSVVKPYRDAISFSDSITVFSGAPWPAGLNRLYLALGAVERRPVHWDVPPVLGVRVEILLFLVASLSTFFIHLVPLAVHARLPLYLEHPGLSFGDTRPSSFVFGSSGASPCGDEHMHGLGHQLCPGEGALSLTLELFRED